MATSCFNSSSTLVDACTTGSAGNAVSTCFTRMSPTAPTVSPLTSRNRPLTSVWLRSSKRMRWTSRSAPVWESNRFVPIASISSMKMIAGAFSLACGGGGGWFEGWAGKWHGVAVRASIAHVWKHFGACVTHVRVLNEAHTARNAPV